MAMDDVTLQNIRDRFAALPPGAVFEGHWWDVRDHGMALLAEIDRLRAEQETSGLALRALRADETAVLARRVEVLREAIGMQAQGRQVTAEWLAASWGNEGATRRDR